MAFIGLPNRHIDLAAMKLTTIFTTLALLAFPSYSQITIAFPPQGTVVIPDSEITVEIDEAVSLRIHSTSIPLSHPKRSPIPLAPNWA